MRLLKKRLNNLQDFDGKLSNIDFDNIKCAAFYNTDGSLRIMTVCKGIEEGLEEIEENIFDGCSFGIKKKCQIVNVNSLRHHN
jgi:hypothetical protein